MTAALSVRNACKTYADGTAALRGVSFDVEQGGFFGLLGANGAGKTTLISTIAGLSRLSSGRIEIMGRTADSRSCETRRLVGIVPQELVYDPFFTVRETLRIQSGYYGIRRNDGWIDELLHHLSLTGKADTNMRRLSGGMKRRVLIAQALVHRPPLIILDEPTAGVDVELRQSLWVFMRLLNRRGHTVVLTTHYLEEARQHCRRIAILKQGRLAALDDTERLLESESGVRLELTLAHGSRLPPEWQAYQTGSPDGRRTVLLLHDYNHAAAALAALSAADVCIEHFRLPEKDLEQVFAGINAQEGAA